MTFYLSAAKRKKRENVWQLGSLLRCSCNFIRSLMINSWLLVVKKTQDSRSNRLRRDRLLLARLSPMKAILNIASLVFFSE